MRILPFRGYRYNPNRIPNLDDVISLPYDQFKGSRDDRFHQRHPYNIAHLIMNPETSEDSPSWNRYTRSKALLDRWMKESVFLQDNQPSIYPYYQDFPVAGGTTRTRKGFVALGEVTDYSQGIVRPHERTMAKPKQDRLELLRSTRVDSGIIFVLYSDPEGEIESLLDEAIRPQPAISAGGPDKMLNRLWRVSDPPVIARIQQAMQDKSVIIADGHHRFEVAVEFSLEAMKHRSEDPAWKTTGSSSSALFGRSLRQFPSCRCTVSSDTWTGSSRPAFFNNLSPSFQLRRPRSVPAFRLKGWRNSWNECGFSKPRGMRHWESTCPDWTGWPC